MLAKQAPIAKKLEIIRTVIATFIHVVVINSRVYVLLKKYNGTDYSGKHDKNGRSEL
jgi:hypothetical protein